MPALTLTDVRKRFGATVALDGLSLSAKPGAITAVLGPNGAGKTTMIRCCTGLYQTDSGEISVLGHRPGERAAAARVGLMPQAGGSWSNITAVELLDYLARLSANPQPVGELVSLFGIEPFARTAYRRLSGGEQQCVNLAAALVGRPELVFLDEPTAGMDPHARRRTWDILASLKDAGVAVVLTTHAMDEAAALADLVYIVDAGRVAVEGTVAELTASSSLEDVFIAHTTPRRAS
ncbi:MAG: ABC transporter ATP-binding protein [Propionibacteriaceae bacterium]|nr:ABC transporter ATP-binding protein [Propionibacteriaceae bacterium]